MTLGHQTTTNFAKFTHCLYLPLDTMTGHQMKLMRKHITLELRFFIPNITNLRRSQHNICLPTFWMVQMDWSPDYF